MTARDTVTESERGARALTLLRELRRIKSVGIATESLMFLAGFASQWRDTWREVDELLAEEVPGTEVRR